MSSIDHRHHIIPTKGAEQRLHPPKMAMLRKLVIPKFFAKLAICRQMLKFSQTFSHVAKNYNTAVQNCLKFSIDLST